jgi:hypothetical protein
VPSAIGTPSPVTIPIPSQQSNLQQLYTATPDVVMPPPLLRDEHPGIRFWEQPLWAEWVEREVEKGSFNTGVQGQGKNSSFMEDADGNRVHISRQKQILEEAHSCWRTMHSFNINLARYREMPATVVDYFRAWMESKCPELQLCAGHWKADKVWHENFSSWNPKKARRTSKPQDAGDELPQPGPSEPSNGRRNL